MRGFIEAPINLLEGFGANAGVILTIIGLIIAYFVYDGFGLSSNETLGYIFSSAPLWFPFVMFALFFEYWMLMVQKEYDLAQGRVTLEIKLPQEIFKSPEAMELVLIQLHQVATPDNHIQTYWDGKHPPIHALEIVSRGGDVRFYINVPRKKFKNIAETQLYAHYPGIEVEELSVDYVSEIPWDPTTFSYFSIHFGLKKADALPLKTYVDYGLQTMPKEEEKVDPITSMLDAFGSIGPGEYYWMQILIDAHREETFKTGSLIPKPDWRVDAKKEITKIIDEAVERAGAETKGNVMQLLTETEKDTIKAIERSIGKNAFNTVIRGMYIAKNDVFNPGERIGALITSWRGYDDLNRNAIGVRWRTDFDWNWWQDRSGKRKMALKKQELVEYKLRAYTRHAATDKSKIMTTEELATVFHLPGKVAITPTLGRIPSTRGEAPPNLPIQ